MLLFSKDALHLSKVRVDVYNVTTLFKYNTFYSTKNAGK